MMKIWFLIFIPILAAAEYRIYQYHLYDGENTPQVVTSSFDPVSYRAYYGGGSIQIDLLRSWMCPGHTGQFKEPCKNPYDLNNESVVENP